MGPKTTKTHPPSATTTRRIEVVVHRVPVLGVLLVETAASGTGYDDVAGRGRGWDVSRVSARLDRDARGFAGRGEKVDGGREGRRRRGRVSGDLVDDSEAAAIVAELEGERAVAGVQAGGRRGGRAEQGRRGVRLPGWGREGRRAVAPGAGSDGGVGGGEGDGTAARPSEVRPIGSMCISSSRASS